MKLLTVYDEVKNIKVIGNRYDTNAIHQLDAETDREIRRIASRYFKGDKTIKLRRMEKENAYMLYKPTDIVYGNDDRQAQGIIVQYNMVDKEPCEVAFFTTSVGNAGEVKSIMSNSLHRIHYTEGNAKALKDDSLFYDAEMAKVFGEVGDMLHIAEKDSGVFHKNRYLLLEKGRLKTEVLFDLYQSIKRITGDENAHYSKTERRLEFTLPGSREPQYINILGGCLPEMDGQIFFSKEDVLKYVNALIRGERTAPQIFYGGTEIYLREYSHTKKLDDLIESRFKDRYLESLIASNGEILTDLSEQVQPGGTQQADAQQADTDIADER